MSKGLLMKQILVTLTLIVGLGTPVSADDKPFAVGDVFFCQMDKLVDYDWKATGERFRLYRNENFRFTISEDNTLRFGDSGVLQGVEVGIYLLGVQKLSAQSNSTTVNLNGTWFSYATVTYESITMIAANCDRF